MFDLAVADGVGAPEERRAISEHLILAASLNVILHGVTSVMPDNLVVKCSLSLLPGDLSTISFLSSRCHILMSGSNHSGDRLIRDYLLDAVNPCVIYN